MFVLQCDYFKSNGYRRHRLSSARDELDEPDRDLYEQLTSYDSPEIVRISAEYYLLKIICSGVDIKNFQFLQPPSFDAILSGLKCLKLTGLIDITQRSTNLSLEDDNIVMPTDTTEINISTLIEEVFSCGAGYTLRPTLMGELIGQMPLDILIGRLLITTFAFNLLHLGGACAGVISMGQYITLTSNKRVGKHNRVNDYQNAERDTKVGADRQHGTTSYDTGTNSHDTGGVNTDASDVISMLRVYQMWIKKMMPSTEIQHQSSGEGSRRRIHTNSSAARLWAVRHDVDHNKLCEIMKLSGQLCDVLVQAPNYRYNTEKQFDKLAKAEDPMAELEGIVDSNPEELRAEQRGKEFCQLSRQKRSANDNVSTLRAKLKKLKTEVSMTRQPSNLKIDDDNTNDTTDYGDEMIQNDSPDCSIMTTGGSGDGGDDLDEMRAIEFTLLYNKHNNIRLLREDNFDLFEVMLIRVLIGMSFYPNVGIPHSTNQYATKTEDCIFQCRAVPFVFTHPSSTLVPSLKQLCSSGQGLECLVYSSILQTRKPYMMHVTCLRLLPLLFISSYQIDTNYNCSMIIFDNWVQLWATPKTIYRMLNRAAVVRRIFDMKLSSVIGDVFDLSDTNAQTLSYKDAEYDDPCGKLDVKNHSLPNELEILIRGDDTYKDKLTNLNNIKNLIIELFYSDNYDDEDEIIKTTDVDTSLIPGIPFTIQTMTDNEYKCYSRCNKLSGKPQLQNVPPQCVKLTKWLNYNTIIDTVSLESNDISDNLAAPWTCSGCSKQYFTKRGQRLLHLKGCSVQNT